MGRRKKRERERGIECALLPLIHAKSQRESMDGAWRACSYKYIWKLCRWPKWQGKYCGRVGPPSKTVRLMKEEQLVHSWGKNYNQSDKNNTLVLYENQFMLFQTAI